MSEFQAWFTAQHGPRQHTTQSDDVLREAARHGDACRDELRRRQLWDEKQQSALYAWTARDAVRSHSYEMAMLPNAKHPGPGCSCAACLRGFPDETSAVCPVCKAATSISANHERCANCGWLGKSNAPEGANRE